MRVLLVRPVSPNDRFGLGPFFRVEPLGLEYVAAALRAHGHHVDLVDLRFGPSLKSALQRARPAVVGIACIHTVDTDSTLAVAAAVKAHDPRIFVLLGGHAAAVHPTPLFRASVDAIALGDGEHSVPLLVDALAAGERPSSLEGFVSRDPAGNFCSTPEAARVSLDEVPLPARDLVAPYQHHYLCVHKSPLWALETARGCPFRCSFCSVWKHSARTYRLRNIDAVCNDFARVGANLFVVDDLFFYPRARSLELARELRRRGVRKEWILVQSRLDTVARSADVLEAWRPLSRDFDIFFGFEAATPARLEELDKDLDLVRVEEGVALARSLRFGVTGNFVIDPDWGQEDFEAMWAMVDRLDLRRAGYTVLTPLPGTPLYDRLEARLLERDWAKFDMHHVLYEPRLGRHRFFELFVASWRRNVLSPRHARAHWWKWLRQLRPVQAWTLLKVLWQTQRLLDVDAYLDDAFPLQVPASITSKRGDEA
jgi:radical SAM superfamily enzyme YgiQ (UPF0313 family)